MKLIGLISPNSSEDTLADVYKIFPKDIRIEARTLHVGKYTDDEFHRAELSFQGLVRDLVKQPLDFLMVTGELFLSYKGPGSDREILDARQTDHADAGFDGIDRGNARLSCAGTQARGDGFAIPRGPRRAAGEISRPRRH